MPSRETGAWLCDSAFPVLGAGWHCPLSFDSAQSCSYYGSGGRFSNTCLDLKEGGRWTLGGGAGVVAAGTEVLAPL